MIPPGNSAVTNAKMRCCEVTEKNCLIYREYNWSARYGLQCKYIYNIYHSRAKTRAKGERNIENDTSSGNPMIKILRNVGANLWTQPMDKIKCKNSWRFKIIVVNF